MVATQDIELFDFLTGCNLKIPQLFEICFSELDTELNELRLRLAYNFNVLEWPAML